MRAHYTHEEIRSRMSQPADVATRRHACGFDASDMLPPASNCDPVHGCCAIATGASAAARAAHELREQGRTEGNVFQACSAVIGSAERHGLFAPSCITSDQVRFRAASSAPESGIC